MTWCWLIGHKWVSGEWYPWPGGPDGWETRTAKCPRCDKIMYRQVRDSGRKLMYY